MVGSPGSDNEPEPGAKQNPQWSEARRARERELQRRRSRGEISCAECRRYHTEHRLKLKCNKKVPCASCIRRGCHTICPNGLLRTGQGSRFVLANTDKLHVKLLQMSQRIRQLEDALQIAHSSVSKEVHPLLAEGLLSIKSGIDVFTNKDDGKGDADAEEKSADEEIAAALGTLAISECGLAFDFDDFFNLNCQTLLMNEQVEEATDAPQATAMSYSDVHDQLPDLLLDAAQDFPLQYRNFPKNELFRLILEHIPTYERATALVEAYLENVVWHPKPVERDQIMETLLPLLYKAKQRDATDPLDEDGQYNGTTRVHSLALTLAVFACGAAADLTQEPDNQEGKLYYVLSLAALNGHSIVGTGGASLETVQAVTLIAQYHFIAGNRAALEASWKIFAFALIIAASIGLHRDPAHWNMEPKHIQRRRHVFWEIFSLDKWKSFGTGRPSYFRIQEVDCEFPEDKEAFVDDTGRRHEGLNRWRHRLVKHVIGPLSEHLLLIKPSKYSEILDWDRKVREYDDPPISSPEMVSTAVGDVKSQLWATHKNMAILHIHKNLFARAMMKHPDNPLRSPFAPSFLAAYAGSIKLLRNMRVCFDLNPGSTIRLWPLWTHCLTSSVVLGSVASITGQPQLAGAAFQNLELAIKLFEGAQSHPVSKRGLPILVRLRERARVALQNMAQEAAVPSGVSASKVEQEELVALRGTTLLLREKRSHEFLPSPRWNSDDGQDSLKFNGSGYASSTSPAPVVESNSSARNVSDSVPFASANVNAPITSSSRSKVPSDAQAPYQPISDPMSQDIASLFNALYNTSSNDATSLMTSSVLSNFDSSEQQQGQSTNQQLSYYAFGNLQTTEPVGRSSAALFSSNSLLDEAAQLEALLSSAFGNHNGSNTDTTNIVQSANAGIPPYDFSWLSSNGPEAPSQFSGNSAQFMEDWRFQAAIEGSHFLTESDADSGMNYLP